MADGLSNLAKNMLADPEWAKMFKLNVDVLEDHMNTGFIAAAALALGIKFSQSFGVGSISCFLTGLWVFIIESEIIYMQIVYYITKMYYADLVYT